MNAVFFGGSLRCWILAARPKTLTVGLLPVVAATALAEHRGQAHIGVSLFAAMGALFIQIGTNLFNDWADFFKGADTGARIGPKRATQQGLIAPKRVLWAACISFFLAACCGLYLLPIGGWPIFAVGVFSIASGFLYTGGPYPLAYHGLGDLFVFVFFGLVAVGASFWLQTGVVSIDSVLIGSAIGLFSTAILVVNNLRDRHTDAAANKRTLAVRFGARAARIQYLICVAAPYFVSCILAIRLSRVLLLPLVTLPWAARLHQQVRRNDGAALNPLLGHTAQLELVWTLLCSAALLC